jgi:hypothetical protein
MSELLAQHKGEDGFGAFQTPPCSADIEPVADQVAACSFDDSGGDWASLLPGPGRSGGIRALLVR